MNISGQRILLTGAAGGIGSVLAKALAERGAELVLVDIDAARLESLRQEILASGGRASAFQCDLSLPGAPSQLCDRVLGTVGSLQLLVNCAGLANFGEFEAQSPESLEKLWRINVLAPMELVRAVLPHMKSRKYGRIVNVGSIFGSIGFAFFTSYSASKFAMRGFSEALRRELAGSGVGVTYVAPRYTRTPLNHGPVSRMAEAVGMNSDAPEVVVRHVVRAIEKNREDYYIGWPECLFVRINAIFPRLVDGALHKQNQTARRFALQQVD